MGQPSKLCLDLNASIGIDDKSCDDNNNPIHDIVNHVSEYIDADQVNYFLNGCLNGNDISIMHINARSLKKNFDSVNQLVASINCSLSAICISETWLNEATSSLFNLPGYTFISNSRPCRSGGGIGIYLNEILNYKILPKYSKMCPHIESLVVEVNAGNSCKFILGCIYRPPDADVICFNDDLDNILNSLSAGYNKSIFLVGDFNLDLLKFTSHQPTETFLHNMLSKSLFPLIRNPTRITDNSASLLDNIFTNKLDGVFYSAIIHSDISDHFPVIMRYNHNVRNATKTMKKKESIPIRTYTPDSIASFNNSLMMANWQVMYDCATNADDPHNIYDKFMEIYSNAFDTSFPCRTHRKPHKLTPRTPWITKGLIVSCNRKARLYCIYCKSRTDDNKRNYTKYRNKLQSLINRAKKDYFVSKFDAAKGDTKKTWQIIGETLNSKHKENLPDSFTINDVYTTNKIDIASEFNNFFSNIGANHSAAIQPTDVDPSHYLLSATQSSMALFPTSSNEIINIVNSLSSKDSYGHDNIPIKILKSSIHSIAAHLSFLVNHSFNLGYFPNALKIAKVCPIFKSGARDSITNYRPISLLPSFSKVYEKALHDRLTSFLTANKIFVSNQFGFRKGHSTYMPIMDLYDKVTEAMQRKEFVLAVFLDLAKAFDTLDYSILCNKLHHYGVRGIALSLFRDYLTNRKQYVKFHDTCSSTKSMHFGVPQGSILGPLLFLLYVNDIVHCSSILRLLLFADDTTAINSNVNYKDLITNTNCELAKLSIWFRANKLSLNISKTNFMIFGSKHIPINSLNLLSIDDNVIERVSTVKFLGVVIDDKLSWGPHIKLVAVKLSKGLGILYRVRYCVPASVLRIIYDSLIYPYLTYCTLVWGGAYPSLKKTIVVLQNKIVRIITFSDYRASSLPLYRKLNFMCINDIYMYQVVLFMFQLRNNLLPVSCQHYCVPNDFPNYNTRGIRSFYKLLPYRSNLRKYSISIIGPLFWKDIPNTLQNIPYLFNFKRELKSWIINQHSYAIN